MTAAATVAIAQKALRKVLGVDVTYCRGATEIAITEAIDKGITKFRFDDQNGFTQHVETQDFLIEAAQLEIEDTPIEPRSGDRIKRTLNGSTLIYEVGAPNNEPCFRPTDNSGRTQYRIHTLQIGTTTP